MKTKQHQKPTSELLSGFFAGEDDRATTGIGDLHQINNCLVSFNENFPLCVYAKTPDNNVWFFICNYANNQNCHEYGLRRETLLHSNIVVDEATQRHVKFVVLPCDLRPLTQENTRLDSKTVARYAMNQFFAFSQVYRSRARRAPTLDDAKDDGRIADGYVKMAEDIREAFKLPAHVTVSDVAA